MHVGFNNQFIQAMRTRPIFQKILKNLFVFGITNLYIKRFPDIKNMFFYIDIRTVRFYPIR